MDSKYPNKSIGQRDQQSRKHILLGLEGTVTVAQNDNVAVGHFRTGGSVQILHYCLLNSLLIAATSFHDKFRFSDLSLFFGGIYICT